jgi:hypothetical protein
MVGGEGIWRTGGGGVGQERDSSVGLTPCVHVCMCVCVCVCAHTHTSIHTCARAHTHKCSHTAPLMRALFHFFTHTHTHTHTHTSLSLSNLTTCSKEKGAAGEEGDMTVGDDGGAE